MNTYLTPLLWKISFIAVAIFITVAILKLIYLKLSGKPISKIAGARNTMLGSGLKKALAPHGFIFGFLKKNKVYLENTKEGHIAIFGGSGIGKTSALLIPTLREWNSPFFAIDISGDISKNVKLADEEKVIIEPENPGNSVTYNVFYLIDKATDENDKRTMLEQLVMLIIDIPSNANDANLYFLETARKIFLAGLLAFYDIGLDFTDICKTIFFNK